MDLHVGLRTTQLYFTDELVDEIYQMAPRIGRHPTPFRNSNDRVKYWGLSGQEPTGVYPTKTADDEAPVGMVTLGIRHGSRQDPACDR